MAPKKGMYDDLVEWIKVHEGYRRFAYECTEGRLTIGYGTMIEEGGHGVPEWVAELLLRDYLETLLSRFLTQKWFKQLDDARRSGILSMGYQMGYEGVLSFKRMIDAIKHSDWDDISRDILLKGTTVVYIDFEF